MPVLGHGLFVVGVVIGIVVAVVVVAVVIVFVANSMPKAYPRMALASASTLSGSVVRTLRGGEDFLRGPV